MAKSSKEQQTEDERKILLELQKNSKESIDTIAKHCGFSRQKAWKIIKRLEEKDVIWGYTAIVNEEKIGQTHFMLMIKRTKKKLEEEITDIDKNIDELVYDLYGLKENEKNIIRNYFEKEEK